MQKVNDNDIEKVAGGKIEHSKVGESLDYEKCTCDECGKILHEAVTVSDEPYHFNSAYKFYDSDCGIQDEDCDINLCYDCYKKRLMRK